MTSNAGGLLLGGADKAIRLIERVAKCFVDRRDPSLIEHSVATLVGQRIFGLALGYEDLNDHDALRHDPLFAVLASKLKARRTDCAPVAGKSTLNRLERSKETPSLYHKIGHDGAAIEKLLVDLFLEISRERARGNHPRSGRDRRPSARRAGGALLPRLLRLLLLPAVVRFLRRPTAGRQIAQGRHRRERGAADEIARVIARIRARWPKVRIMLRADSGFARGTDGLVRDQRRRVFVRSGAELAAERRDRRRSGAAAETSLRQASRRDGSRISSTARWTVGAANVA